MESIIVCYTEVYLNKLELLIFTCDETDLLMIIRRHQRKGNNFSLKNSRWNRRISTGKTTCWEKGRFVHSLSSTVLLANYHQSFFVRDDNICISSLSHFIFCITLIRTKVSWKINFAISMSVNDSIAMVFFIVLSVYHSTVVIHKETNNKKKLRIKKE